VKRKKGKGEARDEQVSPWKSRLARMKEYQKKNSKSWRRNERLLFGATTESEQTDNEYSYGWGLVKSLETAIYVTNPESMVEARTGTKMEVAKLLSHISQFDIEQMDVKSQGNIGLMDNFVCGYMAMIERIDTDKEKVVDKEEEGENKEVDRAVDQRYVAERIMPEDILFDPSGRKLDLSDHKYVAVAFYPTVAELMADKEVFDKLPPKDDMMGWPEAAPGYRKGGREEAKSGSTRGGQEQERDPEFKRVCIWEFHDKVNQKVIYHADASGKDIGEGKWPVKYKIGGRTMFPITLMAFNAARKGFYPKPEIDFIAPQLEMLNKLDAEIYQDVLTKWRKFVTFADLISPDQASKITDPMKNELIQVDRDTLAEMAGTQNHQYPNINELVGAIQDPSVPKDSLAVREMIHQEITNIMGYGPPDRAGLPRTRSAREAVAVKERLEARLAKRADAVADFYRQFIEKHLIALQQTMVIDRYVRIFDQARNLTEFRNYNAEDIDGNFNLIVFAGTSMPRNTEAHKNSEVQLFQTLQPLVMKGIIPPEPPILRLAEAFQWKGVDALLRNYKPAMAQLAKIMLAMTQGKVPPNALPEAAAAAVQAALTPEELQLIAQEIQGKGGAPQGNQESPQSRGDAAPTDTGAGVE